MAIAGVLEIQMLANMARLSDDMRRAERVVGDSMGKVERSVASAKRAMSSLGMGVSIGLIADQMRRISDTFIELDAQLRNSTKSQQQYNQALADIRRISTVAQSDISTTSMFYARLLNTTDGMGISQAKLATVTETVTYGLKAYGATSAEAASAALQLSQAIGSNRLGGEEFRAVMEAMPNVMKVLAKSMGVPLGELRALSIAGKITTAEIVKAFGDPAVAAEFKRMAEGAQTITGAWTVARNEFTLLFGGFAKSSGLTQGVIAGLNGLAGVLRITAQYLNDVLLAVGIWATLVGGRLVASLVAARMNQIALTAAHGEALAMNLMMARAEAANALVARDAAAARAWQTGVTTGLTAANARLAASTAAVATAERAATAAQKSRLSSIRGFVGANKLGLIGLALWGSYEVANHMGWIDRYFVTVEEHIARLKKEIEGMTAKQIEAELRLAQAELERQQAAERERTRTFGGGVTRAFVEAIGAGNKELYDSEQRVKTLKKAYADLNAEANKPTAPLAPSGDGKKHQAVMERIRKEYEARSAAEGAAMSEAQKVAMAYAKIDWERLNADEKRAEMAAFYGASQAAQIQDQLEAARKLQDEWIKVCDAIANDLTQGIITGFENGRSLTPAFVDSLRQSFKRVVLEPTVKLVLSPITDAMASFTASLKKSFSELIAKLSGSSTSSSGNMWLALGALVAAGISSLGSKERGISAEQLQAMQGAGTVLGDINAKSMSIANGIETLNKYTFSSSYFLRDMRDSLRSLNSTIRQMVMNSALGGFGANAAAGMGLSAGRMDTTLGAKDFGASGWWIPGRSSLMGKQQDVNLEKALTGLGPLSNSGFADYIRNRSFLRTNRQIDAQGVGVAGTLEQLRGGVGGYNYATGTDTSTALWGLYSSSQAWRMQQGSMEVSKMFGDVLGRVADMTKKLGVSVGADAAALDKAISSFVFSTGDINLQGMTAAQQIAALTSVLSQQSDLLVGSLMPSMKQFQQSGEGLLDTLIRVVTEVDMTRNFLDILGSSIYSTWSSAGKDIQAATVSVVEFVTALGGLDSANKKMSDFISNFADAGTKRSIAQKTLEQLGLPLLKTAKEWFDFSKTATAEQLATLLNNQPTLLAWIDAIKSNTDATLQAIAANKNLFETAVSYRRAIGTAGAIPAFATGGDHMGGLRLVGENGPELEATGPSRIYNASQTASMLSGNGGGASVADEVRLLRAEAKAHAIALNTATQKLAKIADRWDLQGLPPERLAG